MVRVGKRLEIRLNLVDLQALLLTTTEQPTNVNELVLMWPSDAGYVNASATGVDGALFPLCEGGKSLVWRIPWPPDIRAALVSLANPKGNITNSDLQQAGVVLQFAICTCNFPAHHSSTLIFSDHVVTVSWSTLMADRSAGNIARRLTHIKK